MSKLTKLVQSLLLLAGTAIAAIIGWLLWQFLRQEEETEEATLSTAALSSEMQIPLPYEPEADEGGSSDAQGGGDDLTRIAGIGPRYAEGLRQAGITSFSQLSRHSPDDLAALLRLQGVRVTGDRIRQDDWIGQAARLSSGRES